MSRLFHPRNAAFALGLALALSLTLSPPVGAAGPEAPTAKPRPSEYVDSAVCATCHRDIAASFSQTGMGRSTYRPSPAKMDEDYSRNNTLYHQSSDRHYTLSRHDGRYYQRRHQIGFDGNESNVLEERIDFVIGSGNHAHTYLHQRKDGTLTELPVSWYAEQGGHWGMSPGYDRADQDDFRRVVSNECLFCHNAYPLRKEAGISNLDQARLTPSVQNGIGCQRCHGPGATHATLAGSGHATPQAIRQAIVNPARLNRDRQLEVCMQCHLETSSSPLPNVIERYGRDVFSYKPGQPLADFRIYFDRSDDKNQGDRFEIAHAAYRLRMSACFRQSQMTCTTCHNPHSIPRGAQAIEHYTKVCRSCHEEVHASQKMTASCMDCHMPKRRAEDAVQVVMTDHFIQRNRPSRDLLAPLDEITPAAAKFQGTVKLYYPPALANAADKDLYLAAAQVLDGSNLSAGIVQLARAIQTYSPRQPQFLFDLGKAYSDAGDRIKAIRFFEQSLERQPNFKSARQELVAALFANNATSRAVQLLEASVRAGDADSIVLTNLGNGYLRQGKLAAAEQVLQRSLTIDPESPESLNLLGLIRVQRGGNGASQFFREAIRANPNFAEAHNNLATSLTSARDYREASFEFEKAISADPSYAEAHHGYGLLLELTHSYDQALAQLRESVRLDPQLALAHNDLADLLSASGRRQEAEQEYRLAVTVNPALAEAFLGLANVLIAEGNPAEAEAQLRTAVRLNPSYYEAHLQLAKLLAAAGNPREARAHFLKAAESPDPELSQAARQASR